MITNLVLVAIFLFAAYKGFQKGFLLEIVSLLAFFLAVLGGFKLLDFGIGLLEPYRDSLGGFLPIAAFILVFVAILVVLNVVGRVFKKIIDLTLLGSFDSLAGALLGIFKMALFVSVVHWVFASIGFGWPQRLYEDSVLYRLTASIAPKVAAVAVSLFPSLGSIGDKVGDFLKSLSL